MNWISRLYVRWRDRHDAAWQPTGYTSRFSGHDEARAVEAAKRASLHEREAWKAAAKRAVPRAQRVTEKPEKVTAIRRVSAR